MWNASPAKAAAYRKAFYIGLLLTLTQLFILFFVVLSRTLGADTVHSAADLATLWGTMYLLGRTWVNEEMFLKRRRQWLCFGVWSLALGGLFVGGESLFHLLGDEVSSQPQSWLLLLTALLGAIGNWRMHNILEAVTHADRDALDKNNLDHVFWDMILSLGVFVSGCSMWILGTSAIDHFIAVLVGFIILPYLAWKRWKEDKDEHGHHHHH